MKKLKLVLGIALAFLLLTSGKSSKPHKTSPPGTVWLKDMVYIDCAPISNKAYLEFLSFSKTANWEKCFSDDNAIPQFGLTWDSLSKMLHYCPSDAKFLKRFEPADSVIEIYSKDMKNKTVVNPFRHKEYYDHPIVNISYEQAVKFCEWRSKMVAYNMAIECKTAADREKKHYKKIKFRLPTKEEWEFAVKNFTKIKNPKRKEFVEGQPMTLKTELTSKFKLNPFSIAEMLNEKGKCEGLSYKDVTLTDIYTTQSYFGTQPWVGFRCVCDVE